jgi:hypothetical protein
MRHHTTKTRSIRVSGRPFLLLALCLAVFQSSQAQESANDFCGQLSTLIQASKTSFGSIVGAAADERSYNSKLDLSDWGDGFVYLDEAEGAYVLYVALGGNDLGRVKKQYSRSVSQLSACLRGWKRSETSGSDYVMSTFVESREGSVIDLEYNTEPSEVGSTKYDLYLTVKVPASEIEKPFCGHLSTLIGESQTGFDSIRGPLQVESQHSYTSTFKLAGWGGGTVFRAEDEPHVLYVKIGSNRIPEVKTDYDRWLSKLTACLPGWKRTESSSKEEIKSVFIKDGEGASIQLDYNLEPSKVGATKFDLYLTVRRRGVTERTSP